MRFVTFTGKETGLPVQVNLNNVCAIVASEEDDCSFIFFTGQEEPLGVKEGLAFVVAAITMP